MQVRCGTSGFSYKEWKGRFYPEKLPAARMLAHYASELATVEINNTFYRMPRPELLQGWRTQVPSTFRFAIKASRRITHIARLRDCGEALGWLWQGVAPLGQQLGTVLFQLPPNLKRDTSLLQDFLRLLPPTCHAAFEFREPSWFDDRVFELLSAHPAALVGGDLDDAEKSPPWVRTAPFGYLRLRRSDYTEAEVRAWADRIAASECDEVYAFFKHELRGPELARQLQEAVGERVRGA